MERRLLAVGLCFLILGLQDMPAGSAERSTTSPTIHQAGLHSLRCRGCGRIHAARLSCCPHCGTGTPSGQAGTGAAGQEAPLPPSLTDDESAADTAPVDLAPPANTVAAAPSSMAPNMIGDFLMPGGGSWSIIQPPTMAITYSLAPLSGPYVGQIDRNQPSWATSGSPVEFDYSGETLNGVIVPATVFSSLTNQENLAPLNVGESFAMDSGSTTYQDAMVSATIAGLGPGSASIAGMDATLSEDDGSPGGEVTTSDFFFVSQYVDYTPAPVAIYIPSPGLMVATTKIAENSSPMPQDRFYFNYSYFDNATLFPGGVDVSRFTPGFEKTFFGGIASFDVRFPMAATLDSTIVANGSTDLSNGEFGNIGLTPKVLLHRGSNGALAMGMTVAIPTADDVNVTLADGTDLVEIENEAVHLMPFFGAIWTPNPCWFAQGFLQYDVATTGNPVSINPDGEGLQHSGYLNEATFQYLDLSLGRWLYRPGQRSSCASLRSVALAAEIHWSKSLQEGDYIARDNFVVGNTASNVDVWNGTIGLHVQMCETTISAAYVAPLTEGGDRPFDGEFRIMINRWFGRSASNGNYPGIF